MKRTTVVPWRGLAITLVLGAGLLAQGQQPLIGTWKLNAAPSLATTLAAESWAWRIPEVVSILPVL